MPVHDAGHLALERGVERRFDAPRGRAGDAGQRALHEVRGEEGALRAHDAQSFAAGRLVVLGGKEAQGPHALEHPLLPPPRGRFVTIRIERGRPLGQTGQEGRLGRREVLGRGVEIGAAGRLCALELVPVGRDVQVQGQDLALRELVLDAQGEQRFAQLAPRGAIAVDEHLDRLLRQRRSAFDHPAGAHVVPEGPHEREGVDPRVMEEARVLRGQGGLHERVGKAVGIDEAAALAFGGERLPQGLAVARDDLGRGVLVQGEKTGGQGPQPDPARAEGRGQGDRHRTAPRPLHGCTVTTAEPVRPKTSGSYISSTCVGAVRNVPEVVARAT